MKKQNTQSTKALFHSLSGGLELIAPVLCSSWRRRNTIKIKNGNFVKDFYTEIMFFLLSDCLVSKHSEAHMGEVKK